MKRTQKEILQQTEAFLNERYFIANMEDAKPQDMSYYHGAIEAVNFLGYAWKRSNGKHTLYKN